MAQGHRNQPVITNRSPVATTAGPDRTHSVTYPQSEVGTYTTTGRGSNNAQGMSRLSTRHVQFLSNPVSCPLPGCAQTFLRADLCQTHLYFQHGLQNRVSPHRLEMQSQESSWNRSQSNSRNQPAIPYLQAQKSASIAERLQSPYQPQTRPMNGGCGPRTAPPSIQPVQSRLAEDFGNSTMISSQELPFAAGSSDNLLIGIDDHFQPDISTTTNLGFDSSQEHDLNVQDDQQKKPTSPLSFDALKSFLREHLSNDRIDLAASLIQGTLESLQSTPSSGDINSIPAASSRSITDDVKPSMRDGKLVYSCPHSGCEKFTLRRCELRKHVQRHTLPWVCTFDRCRRSFGSKNDWKRHETKQHAQQECWRCEELQANKSGRSVPATDDNACMKLFCTEDLYLKHLTAQHNITDDHVTNKLCKSQRIGAKSKGQYWCGFCNKIITMKGTGIEGDNERYNHVDDHFMKDGYRIDRWKALNGRPSPGDSVMVSERTSPAASSYGESDGADRNGEDAADAHASQNPSTTQNAKKRPASPMAGGNQAPAPKVARSSGSRKKTHMTMCCNCSNMFARWNEACLMCNHRYCQHCSTELVDLTEQV